MGPATDAEPSPLEGRSPNRGGLKLTILCLLAVIGGSLVGLLGGAFRWSLITADRFRVDLVDWAHQWPWLGILIPIAFAAACVGLARLTAVWVPESAGSGIQRVEAAMRGQAPLESWRVIPSKLVGGLLAIGSGLALGREGPTVQMGASIGGTLAKSTKLGRSSSYSLEAAMSGAGLAVAFNAPTGGAVFVFEELTKQFKLRLVVPTIAGTATAISVSRWMMGDSPEFSLETVGGHGPLTLAAFFLFGALVGVLGAGYNRTVVAFLNAFDRITNVSPVIKAALVGGGVGALAWFAPNLVGSGDELTRELIYLGPGLLAAAGILVFRWILGPLSYSLGTPGGLFSPLLTLGALCGLIFAGIGNLWFPDSLSTTAFAVVGMSAFFAAVVRAPLTGVIIVAEMAATTALLVPALLACAAATVVTTLLNSEPIYDTLRHRMLSRQPPGRADPNTRS